MMVEYDSLEDDEDEDDYEPRYTYEDPQTTPSSYYSYEQPRYAYPYEQPVMRHEPACEKFCEDMKEGVDTFNHNFNAQLILAATNLLEEIKESQKKFAEFWLEFERRQHAFVEEDMAHEHQDEYVEVSLTSPPLSTSPLDDCVESSPLHMVMTIDALDLPCQKENIMLDDELQDEGDMDELQEEDDFEDDSHLRETEIVPENENIVPLLPPLILTLITDDMSQYLRDCDDDVQELEDKLKAIEELEGERREELIEYTTSQLHDMDEMLELLEAVQTSCVTTSSEFLDIEAMDMSSPCVKIDTKHSSVEENYEEGKLSDEGIVEEDLVDCHDNEASQLEDSSMGKELLTLSCPLLDFKRSLQIGDKLISFGDGFDPEEDRESLILEETFQKEVDELKLCFEAHLYLKSKMKSTRVLIPHYIDSCPNCYIGSFTCFEYLRKPLRPNRHDFESSAIRVKQF